MTPRPGGDVAGTRSLPMNAAVMPAAGAADAPAEHGAASAGGPVCWPVCSSPCAGLVRTTRLPRTYGVRWAKIVKDCGHATCKPKGLRTSLSLSLSLPLPSRSPRLSPSPPLPIRPLSSFSPPPSSSRSAHFPSPPFPSPPQPHSHSHCYFHSLSLSLSLCLSRKACLPHSSRKSHTSGRFTQMWSRKIENITKTIF